MRICGSINFDIRIFEDVFNPGPITVQAFKKEEHMTTFVLNLSDDPVIRERFASRLTIKVGDATQVVNTLPLPVGNSDKITAEVDLGKVGDAFTAEFSYVDRAGNASSSPALFEGVIVDTVLPPNPGPITILAYADADA